MTIYTPPMIRWTKDHPNTQVIGDVKEKVLTRAQLKERRALLNRHQNYVLSHVFISKIEPKNEVLALQHSDWIDAMHMEL